MPQDRSGCCGTMQLDEYMEDELTLEKELAELAKAFRGGRKKEAAGTRS